MEGTERPGSVRGQRRPGEEASSSMGGGQGEARGGRQRCVGTQRRSAAGKVRGGKEQRGHDGAQVEALEPKGRGAGSFADHAAESVGDGKDRTARRVALLLAGRACWRQATLLAGACPSGAHNGASFSRTPCQRRAWCTARSRGRTCLACGSASPGTPWACPHTRPTRCTCYLGAG